MEIVFWGSIALILYAYFGYPILLYVFSFLTYKTVVRDENYAPRVSLIITVHNEQERVDEKIANTLAIEYPEDKLEVIFASDASTDRTDDIILSYPQFRLVRSPERRGKEFAQKCAVEQANGDILVFSDVSTIIEPRGIRMIVANFADPTIGCVSSEDRFIDQDGKISGEGAYVKYEMFLRRLETRVHSVVGLSGSFFAARKKVCKNMAVNLQSDFNTLLCSQKMGLRGISDQNSLGYYKDIVDEKKEFQRKIRTVVRGLNVIKNNMSLLNPLVYGLTAWEILSHKVCRWMVPFCMVMTFIANLFLIKDSQIYLIVFVVQVLFYLFAIMYIVSEKNILNIKSLLKLKPMRKENMYSVMLKKACKFSWYFLVVNYAILIAWGRVVKGENSVYWNPSKR